MTDIAVVIPSWDITRSLTRVREMMASERRRRAEYILVVPDAEAAREVNTDSVPKEFLGWYRVEAQPCIRWITTKDYLSPVEAMALAGEYLLSPENSKRGPGYSPSDIFAFLHDDVLIEERGWDRTIIDHFSSHPRCGLAGFGGGIGFADADIYKVPYDYRQLARIDFVSNMREAEQHGRRVDTAMRVAALDGFALITSREFYEAAGQRVERAFQPNQVWNAWESCLIDEVPFHCYDGWISARAAELSYETWVLPIACHHEGGSTSVARQAEYQQVVERLGYRDSQHLYDAGHVALYQRFAGVLPIRVPKGE